MNDRLSIGVVCFPTLGGSGVVATELALGLARRGHRVHLISSARPSRNLPERANELFHEVRVPSYPLFEHAPYTLAVASKIVDVTREHGLDLLQVHYAVPHAVSALLGPRFPTPRRSTSRWASSARRSCRTTCTCTRRWCKPATSSPQARASAGPCATTRSTRCSRSAPRSSSPPRS